MYMYQDKCVDETMKPEGRFEWCDGQNYNCNLCKMEHFWVTDPAVASTNAWWEEYKVCVWCSNNQEPIRGECIENLMDSAFACMPDDMYTPDNCVMCRH